MDGYKILKNCITGGVVLKKYDYCIAHITIPTISNILFESDYELLCTMRQMDREKCAKNITAESVTSMYTVTKIYAPDNTEIQKGYTLTQNVLHEQFCTYTSNIGLGISANGIYVQGLHYFPSKMITEYKLARVKQKY